MRPKSVLAGHAATGRAIPSRLAFSVLVLVFAFLALAGWHSSFLAAPVSITSALLVAVAVAHPRWGLAALALLLPLATPLSIWFGVSLEPQKLAELLVVSWLLGTSVRFAFSTESPALRLARPALVLILVVAASSVVGLADEQRATAWPATYIASLWQHLRDDYFSPGRIFGVLHDGMPWIEALLLAAFAERVIRTGSGQSRMVAVALLAGATLNAVFTWRRVGEISMRHAYSVPELGGFLLHQRLASLYPDLNAAGSLYAMWFVTSVSLALVGARLWRWAWPVAVVVLLPLWVSGSRSGQMAALLGLLVVWLFTVRVSFRALAITAGVAVALLATLVLWNPGRTAQSSARVSFDVRMEMTRIAGRLVAERPLFGVGIGNFRRASAPYVRPELAAVFPQAAHGENAHNNYVQILAEIGLAGFLSFAWLIGACAMGVFIARGPGRASPALVACAGGVFTFLVTCLSGHPLLLPEILWLFFLMLGITAGLAPPPVNRPSAPWTRATAVLAFIVLASVPVRVWQSGREADLDHVVIGAGLRTDANADRVYRIAEAHSAWYIPSAVHRVEIPLRATADSHEPCEVRVDVEGRPANAVSVSKDAWSSVTLQFDLARGAPVSRRLDMHVQGGACTLMVAGLIYGQ